MSLIQILFFILILGALIYCVFSTNDKACFILFIFLLVIAILLLLRNNKEENFITMDPNYYIYYDQLLPQFWDNKLRRTRNMSYDLRGDVDPDRPIWVPFHMSPLI